MGLVLFIAVILVPMLVFSIWKQHWLGIGINLAVTLLVWHVFATTYYIIRDGTLIVRSSILYNTHIPISHIVSISPTGNPISAPAASLDRLEIRYGPYETILVSPKDKAGFIAHLKAINPKIMVY